MEPQVDYTLLTAESDPTQGFVLKKARAKSKGGTLTSNVQPGESVLPNARAALGQTDDYRKRAADLYQQGNDIYQGYLERNEKAGEGAMLNALAAQFAGEQFAPLQQQFLKKAGSAEDSQAKKAEFLLQQAKAYEALATNADTARERIAAQRKADEANALHKQTMAQIAQQSNGIRALAAQTAALQQQNAAAERRDRQLGEGAQKLSKQTEDFTGLYAGVKQLNDRLAGYAKKDGKVPGIGLGANVSVGGLNLSSPFIGEEGRLNRAMAQNVLNQIIRADSGQAVSTQEAARQLLAAMNSPQYTEEDFLNAWENNILPRVNESFANIGGGYSKDVKDRYRNQGGKIDFDKSFEAPRSAKPQSSGLEPGSVKDGYRFKGGNPGDKNNWEKL